MGDEEMRQTGALVSGEGMMCGTCAKGELHGFPRHEVPDWYCFTVSFYCPIKHHHNIHKVACEEYAKGEPTKVGDDVDDF